MRTSWPFRNALRAVFCSAVMLCTTLLQPLNASASDPGAELPACNISYTASEALTEQFNAVFTGEINLAADRDRTPVDISLAVSSSLDISKVYYAYSSAAQYSGMQCYIYAQAVYATLFDELPYHGAEETVYSYSTQVMGHAPTADYTLFAASRVMPGAYLRTTTNADGTYNGSAGHSLIVLGYDDEFITILEGNADNRGLIRIAAFTWEGFNDSFLSGKGRVISHVVQPLEENYLADYGISFDALSSGDVTVTPDEPDGSYTMHRSGQSIQLPVLAEGLSWSSSDPAVAVVDENGLVTGCTDGEVIITATNDIDTYTFALTLTMIPWDALGDLTGDAAVDAADAVSVLQLYITAMKGEADTIDPDMMLHADVNDNGAIDSTDSLLVLQYYINTMMSSETISAEERWNALLCAE